MSEPGEEDRFLEERAFRIGGSIDIGDLIDDAKDSLSEGERAEEERIAAAEAGEAAAIREEETEDEDEAIGPLFDPFSEGDEAGAIAIDGTVVSAPEQDAVSKMAVEGEQRLHWGLMAAMITVYSLISLVVGFALTPLVAFFGLVALAALGFILSERWVPRASMHNLGIVWVIIAMKILYGLAIELHRWDLFGLFPLSTEALGVSLLLLVGVNIAFAYRHDHDAIATQAVLVLLAISSTAGSFFGEMGVAAMLLLATVLVHSLALHRSSGNLASLGIAASNLWIGMHAVTGGLTLGSLTILPLQTPLLLFMLMLGVNGINATMAARFAREENWFSKGLSMVGLGRPGLWSVSVGLGMVGALMAIAAHREDSAYALGMVTALLAAFAGSYLHVRGVDTKRIQIVLLPSSAVLTFLLVLFDAELLPSLGIIAGYESFTIGAAAVSGWLLLSNQESVTDRVLWMGSIAIAALLTVLIPARALDAGGDGGLLLLATLSILHIGTATLALKRHSHSLAGTAVITPWIWVMVVEGVSGIVRTFTTLNTGDTVHLVALDGNLLGAYLVLASLIQAPCNLAMGEKGVNLADRFLGIAEIAARLRDSGMMRLWNIGWILGLAVWLARGGAGDMSGWVLMAGLGVHAAVHIAADVSGRHQDNPRLLLGALGVSIAVVMWRHGMDGVWLIAFVLASGSLCSIRRDPEREAQMQMLSMTLLTLLILVWGSARTIRSPLDTSPMISDQLTGWLAITVVAVQLAIYLPRVSRYEDLLRPAISSIAMLVATIAAAWNVGVDAWQPTAAGVLLLACGLWLAANGEIRSELKAVAKRESRLASLAESQRVAQALAIGSVPKATLTPSLPESVDGNGTPSSPSDYDGSPDRTYHFPDEATAERAISSDLTAAALASSAQAVSIGDVGAIDPRMVELVEKQRRRRKRSGSTGADDLLIGDIHHRPVVILAFILTGILGASLLSFLNGSFGPGLIALIGIWSVALIAISRWRASVHDLRLPDVMGIETPFAVALLGVGLVQVAAHMSSGASKWDQLDLLALVGVTTILAVMSLAGRSDLAMRIPSSLEWLVLALLLPRLLGALFGEGNPFPLSVDPFDESGELLAWTIPHLVQEAVLIVAVLLWDWIEGVRRSKGMPDHHGANGRGGWAFAIVLLSIGPAGLLAASFAIRRGWHWEQPTAVSIGILAGAITLFAFVSWIDALAPYVGWILVLLGCVLLAVVAGTVPPSRARWTGSFALAAHILLPIGAAITTGGLTVWVLVALFALSMTSWCVGILQLRKGLRFVGAFDLVFALTLALLTMRAALLEPTTALIALVALAIELGVVVWLGQRYQDAMAASE